MNRLVWTVCLSSLFFISFAHAKPLAPEKVPDVLKPWISWVLQEQPERDCPFLYNSLSRSQTPVWECLLPSSAWCANE
jgi:hypothetical protein